MPLITRKWGFIGLKRLKYSIWHLLNSKISNFFNKRSAGVVISTVAVGNLFQFAYANLTNFLWIKNPFLGTIEHAKSEFKKEVASKERGKWDHYNKINNIKLCIYSYRKIFVNNSRKYQKWIRNSWGIEATFYKNKFFTRCVLWTEKFHKSKI